MLVAGLLLALRFHRDRVLFALIVLAAAEPALRLGPPTPHLLPHAVAFLLPLNLAALSLWGDRGAFSSAGAIRLGALAAQVLLVFALLAPAEAGTADLLGTHVFPWVTGWTAVPDLALLLFGVAALALTIQTMLQQHPLPRAFLWALIATFIALQIPEHSATHLATAGLVLIVGVVEASYHLAYRDALTGLPGRRALDETLDRLDGRFSVAMVDVDRFKEFNDRHGHDVGDQVLKLVATTLNGVTGGGRAFRYGGEEFAVVFARLTADEALPRMEELRQSVESTTFVMRAPDRPRKRDKAPRTSGKQGPTLSVTVSIGLAERTDDRQKPSEVIEAADKALYRAKRGGRNRVAR